MLELSAAVTPVPGESQNISWRAVLILFELVGVLRWISDFTLLMFAWLYSTLLS